MWRDRAVTFNLTYIQNEAQTIKKKEKNKELKVNFILGFFDAKLPAHQPQIEPYKSSSSLLFKPSSPHHSV